MFTDPAKLNNIFFLSSGREYFGNRWLGVGQEMGTISLSEELARTAGGFSELIKFAIKDVWQVILRNRHVSLLILFFTYNPE